MTRQASRERANLYYEAFYEWARPVMLWGEETEDAVRVVPEFEAMVLARDVVVILSPVGCMGISHSRLCATPLSPFKGSLKFRGKQELFWTPLWIGYRWKDRLRSEERRVHQTWQLWAMLQKLKATSGLPCAPDKLPRVPRPLGEPWNARVKGKRRHLNAALEWLKECKRSNERTAQREKTALVRRTPLSGLSYGPWTPRIPVAGFN